ncbi:Csa1 family protein [Staphylococcus pettenkoferi]|uniref:Csa1 family protein n=1 Tax=Staphylococcus pettenkoferi TaxID=170573 RepID=UPI000CD1FBBC|nr:Csa1 family protein [Staphylococcus pettenkoferi]MCI2804192.1 tandem-type lipoprotein [Staphylococcus pettenkoferi]MCY1584438.1 tandem-type lipoprotein [Staphylococcus pettenkoferi]MCY1615603.1 tandem-type lipoprotein [Staphylococcus pettenkoferi]MCY1627738.1 tandem-type lipoprotein [Staphylococcus pettenkoferi]PNZ90192.1 hypothetical protein CD126_02455 [Staphylococcus pettenkoferi]
MDIKLFHKEKKNNILKSEGAVLYIDRNKRKATGYYYIKKFSDSGKNDINKYPVKLRKNNLVPTKKDINENVCNKIKKIKFMVQYSNIKSDIHNKKGKYYYNYNLPKFIGSYKVTNNDDIIKKIKKIYNVPYNKATINITGRNKPSFSTKGDKEIEIIFKKNEYFFRDSVDFQPTKESY